MALTPEDLEAIGILWDKREAAKNGAPKVEATSAPKPPVNAPPLDSTNLEEMIARTVASSVASSLQQQTQAKESELGQSLWQERMNEMTTRNPALAEYLEGEDDWGAKRIDKINGIESYAERVKAMTQLSSRFSEAQVMAASTNSAPKIPKRIQEQADRSNKQYDDLEAKLEAGEITPEQHTKGFFDLFDSEVLSKM